MIALFIRLIIPVKELTVKPLLKTSGNGAYSVTWAELDITPD
jgi:hypothetical protein